METRYLTCIQCPMGCALTVEMDGTAVKSVSGQTCKRGEVYAKKEVTAPTRTVTSTVKALGGKLPVLSVKTKTDIPKDKIFACMEEINRAVVTAPIKIGDVIIENVSGTGVPVVATANLGIQNPV